MRTKEPVAVALSESVGVATKRRDADAVATSLARPAGLDADGAPGGVQFPYQPQLDGIRALAVIAVMLCHAFPRFAGGGFGVDLFFCLSGFLITSLLIAEWRKATRVRLGRFWARRALRLLPALFAVLIAVGIYASIVLRGTLRSETIGAIPGALLYFGNWRRALGHHSLGMLGPTWSLSVEEQFYLVWPLVTWLVLRYSRRPFQWVLSIAVAGCMATTLHRVLMVGRWTRLDVRRLNGTDLSADQLLAGCALAAVCALLSSRGNARLGRVFGWLFPAAVALLGCAAAGVLPTWMPLSTLAGRGLFLVALASAVIIGHVALSPRSVAARALKLWPFPQIGRISYGIYLWHFPVFIVVATHVRIDNLWIRGGVLLGSAIAVAALCYFVVERPFLRLKNRLREHDLQGELVAPGAAMSGRRS